MYKQEISTGSNKTLHSMYIYVKIEMVVTGVGNQW